MPDYAILSRQVMALCGRDGLRVADGDDGVRSS